MFAQLLFFLNVIPLGFCLTSLFFQKSLQVRPGPPPTGRPKKNLWGFLTSRMPALPLTQLYQYQNNMSLLK